MILFKVNQSLPYFEYIDNTMSELTSLTKLAMTTQIYKLFN